MMNVAVNRSWLALPMAIGVAMTMLSAVPAAAQIEPRRRGRQLSGRRPRAAARRRRQARRLADALFECADRRQHRAGRGFEKKYGIKVNLYRASSEEIRQRVVNEARARRFDVDFILNNAPAMEALTSEKLLVEVKSPHVADLMPQAIAADRSWVGFCLNVLVAGLQHQARSRRRTCRRPMRTCSIPNGRARSRSRPTIPTGSPAWWA